jgi:hypothetical protein
MRSLALVAWNGFRRNCIALVILKSTEEMFWHAVMQRRDTGGKMRRSLPDMRGNTLGRFSEGFSMSAADARNE